MFSTMFEIGGIIGSASIGYVLKRFLELGSFFYLSFNIETLNFIFRFFNDKSLLGSTVETFLSALGLILFILTSNMGIMVNSIVMILIGILNCGPDIILCKSKNQKISKFKYRFRSRMSVLYRSYVLLKF